MDPTIGDVGQLGGGLGFAVAVLLLLKWKLSRDADREDKVTDERSKREERLVVAQEATAKATAEQASALTEMAGAITRVVGEVRDLKGEVQGMRRDLDELTPVLTPSARRAREFDETQDDVPPPRRAPTVHLRRGAGGKEE